MKVSNVGLMIAMAAAAACVSTGQPEYEAAEVVERIGGNSETPAWATGETAVSEEDGKVVFAAMITMGGDSRPEACLRAAADSARVEILRHIRDNLSASGQVSETSAASDPGVESLVAFLSQGKLSGTVTTQRYWEKRVESDTAGRRVLKVFCAAKVGIGKQELSRQLADATGQGGNSEIRKKLIDAQKNFIDSISAGAPAH